MSPSHPLAGKSVTIKSGKLSGESYRIEDWWHVVSGQSWRDSDGNPAAMEYGWRAGLEGKPGDDQVVYGKIGGLGKLMHVSDLGEVE